MTGKAVSMGGDGFFVHLPLVLTFIKTSSYWVHFFVKNNFRMKSLKTFWTTAIIVISAPFLSAQDIPRDSLWKVEGYGAVNLNQVSFTNWAAGGDNSVSFSLIGNLSAKYAKNRQSWDNSANLNYGLIYTKEFGMRKNEDKLELESKYGYALTENKKLALALLGNFKSQFASGYNYPNDSVVISKFAAPGYLTIALGIDWKPVDYFSLFVSPATGRILFVRDQDIANSGQYGNDAAVLDSVGNIITQGDKMRFDFGAYLSAKFQKEVVKNITIMSKFDLFANYTGDTKDSKVPDVNWETAFLFKVNDYLSASLNLLLLYDKEIMIAKDDNDNGSIEANEITDRVQFKEALGVGLTYKFTNKKKVEKK